MKNLGMGRGENKLKNVRHIPVLCTKSGQLQNLEKKAHENGEKIKMKIKKILSQHRRDFTAIYECEHCGYVVERYGYDDENFHKNVIPEMKCLDCGKTADES